MSYGYRQPADLWVKALPVGNGHLGAMQFGGVGADRLQLNEDAVWYGGAAGHENPGRRLTEARITVGPQRPLNASLR
ncbi:hypothetical protein HFN20_25845 [Paenibacillus dendritiformis]|nr:hypothetical protein [Paenibacillus dendritiformis]NRF96939.1 glycoside hydrolase N-terminal domain-containing protein [Paenibacillus dendritiformis]